MSLGNPLVAPEPSRTQAPPACVGARKLGICHVASGDLWAGAEVQVATLLRELVKRPDLELSAILLNEGRLADELRECGVEVVVIPESTTSFPRLFWQAAHYLGTRRVRILHSHRYKENLLAWLMARRCGVPVVIRTQHGLPEPFPGFKHLKQRALQSLDGLVARYGTTRVITVSREMHSALTGSWDGSRLVTIPNGLELARVTSRLTREQAKKALGVSSDSPLVGTVGRLEPVKRFDIFLAAAKHILATWPEARFAIVGTGSQEARLRALAEETGIGGRVLFLGFRVDIYDVLRAFDVYLMCSDHEGLPTALLEALQLGLPVVARPVGGVAEVVQDGVHAVLVPGADPCVLAAACSRLLGDADLRKLLAANGPVRAGDFSSERTAATLFQLYCTLAGET